MKSNFSSKINQPIVSVLLLYVISQCLGKLFFVAAFNQSESPCGNTNITDSKGVISSPNYPSVYENKIECEWRIHSPPESVLKINIVDLDLVKDQPCEKIRCCSQQGLLVPTEGRGSKLLCGNNSIEEPIIVSQPITVIKYFSTSAKTLGRGFQITYSIEERACKSHEFECINGKCVSNDSLCNEIDDCGDGSDERYCPRIGRISQYKYYLKGIPEIASYYPKHTCARGWEICPSSPNTCYSPKSHSCDGKFDCPKGDDEVGCAPNCPEQISCSSGDGCYFPAQRCNLIRNCKDNSDETDCPFKPCTTLQFTCLNRACVSGSKICNGKNDCGDHSDERNCSKSSFLTLAVMGLFSCVMLFCFGLSCLYKIYSAKLRASSFAHQFDPVPVSDEFICRDPPPAYSVAVGDPAFMPCSDSQFTEGYFETDHVPPPPPIPRIVTVHPNRTSEEGEVSEPTATTTSRPRPSVPVLEHGSPNASQFSEVQLEPKNDNISKNVHVPNESNLGEVIELLGCQDVPQSPNHLQETIVETRLQPPRSCTSPSLRSSTESVTSCTTLEDYNEGVRACQS